MYIAAPRCDALAEEKVREASCGIAPSPTGDCMRGYARSPEEQRVSRSLVTLRHTAVLSTGLNEKPCVLTFPMTWTRRNEAAHSAVLSVIDVTCSALEVPTIEKQEATSKEIELPWNVIVHNDPVNLMSYVTMVFQRVFGYPRERAEKHMLEVHHNGRSILWSGVRERAEFYVQQLHGYLLLATVEKIG